MTPPMAGGFTVSIRMFRSSSRGIVLGAVVAIAATIGGGALNFARADVSSGGHGLFVPIVPCRLLDTRQGSNNVGPRTSPLGPGDTYAQAVRGANGNCVVPSEAIGVALNVTIANPTAPSFLTVWPSDATRPLASNLNWIAGSPPTPNKVDVGLSADGKVSFFNNGGDVDVLADVVGYYADGDGRYYTKPQIDSALGAKADKPAGPGAVFVDFTEFWNTNPDSSSFAIFHDSLNGFVSGISNPIGTTGCAIAHLSVPNGVTLTSIAARVSDGSSTTNVSIGLYVSGAGLSIPTLIGSADTGAPANVTSGTTLTDTSISAPLVDSVSKGYYLRVCGMNTLTALYDVTVSYNNP